MPYLRAAADAPFGALPTGEIKRLRAYRKDASASRIFPGDFVKMESDGNIAVATAGDRLLGVAADPSANATADTEVMVYDDQDQLFVIQDDSDTTNVAETNIGNNADIVATTGNTTTGRSNHELDSDTAGTGTAQLRMLGLHPIEAGSFASAAGSPRRWIVRINEHEYGQTSGV